MATQTGYADSGAVLPDDHGTAAGSTSPGTGVPVVAQPYDMLSRPIDMGTALPAARAVPYPYTDPYYGNLVAYGAQALVPHHLLGVQQARMALPSELVEEEPVYVNAKQYHGILRRRQSRAKAEAENRLIKARKPYLHESRHQHALRRARGCGGRFLNATEQQGDERLSDREGERHDDNLHDTGNGVAG
jgi:nuclear transcription factor Y alpha